MDLLRGHRLDAHGVPRQRVALPFGRMPGASTGPLGVSVLPCPAYRVLLGRRQRTTLRVPAKSIPIRIADRISLTALKLLESAQ